MIINKKIGLAILTGGQSKRMGSPKEALILETGGERITFLEHLCRELGAFEYKYISENSSFKYQVEGFESVEDRYPGIGPLGGIYSVLMQTQADAVLFVACDMPHFTAQAAEALVEAWNGDKALIACTCGARQPLAGIYSKECIPYIEEQIKSGNYKLGILIDAVGGRMVDMSGMKEAFGNVNTPEEYRAFISSISR